MYNSTVSITTDGGKEGFRPAISIINEKFTFESKMKTVKFVKNWGNRTLNSYPTIQEWTCLPVSTMFTCHDFLDAARLHDWQWNKCF